MPTPIQPGKPQFPPPGGNPPPPTPAIEDADILLTSTSTVAKQSPWSILLDKIAFAIINWKSTLNGALSIYNYLFILLTGEQFVQASGAHYARWFLASGLVAKAITAALTADKPSGSATGVSVQVGSVTLPDPAGPANPHA